MTFIPNPLESLSAVSAIDGRYRNKILELSRHWSESALILTRAEVEIAWLQFLLHDSQLFSHLNNAAVEKSISELRQELKSNPDHFTQDVKLCEAKINHDVKAVEITLQNKLKSLGCNDAVLALVHFACTSEDINNVSYAWMLKRCLQETMLPALELIGSQLIGIASTNASVAMLSRTHGQTASPTTLGKEIAIFAHRVSRQVKVLKSAQHLAKFNGATGNYSAHLAAFPLVDWPTKTAAFIETLGLEQNPLTTQIESHDALVECTDNVCRINSILIGLCRDIWGYISLGYFAQNANKGEVGSSTMPHKINPIDFENAEANFGLANSIGRHYADKLLISRWQRDLSDSSVLRTQGSFWAHTLLGLKSLSAGLGKLRVDQEKIAADLNNSWEVLAEPAQTLLRKRGVVDAYDRLKAQSRGELFNKAVLENFVNATPEFNDEDKKFLKALTPATYVGVAPQLARLIKK